MMDTRRRIDERMGRSDQFVGYVRVPPQPANPLGRSADLPRMTGTVATKKRSKFTSRAALRFIEPGSSVDCASCGQRVKFQARLRLQQVICNVYDDGVWDRVEHFHAECYETAESPYGEPTVTANGRAS